MRNQTSGHSSVEILCVLMLVSTLLTMACMRWQTSSAEIETRYRRLEMLGLLRLSNLRALYQLKEQQVFFDTVSHSAHVLDIQGRELARRNFQPAIIRSAAFSRTNLHSSIAKFYPTNSSSPGTVVVEHANGKLCRISLSLRGVIREACSR